MAPSRKSLVTLGSLARVNGWRARVNVHGKACDGPQRQVRAEAQADLDRARQCTSRAEMKTYLVSLAQQGREAKITTGQAVAQSAKAPSSNQNNGVEQPAHQPGALPSKRLRQKTTDPKKRNIAELAFADIFEMLSLFLGPPDIYVIEIASSSGRTLSAGFWKELYSWRFGCPFPGHSKEISIAGHWKQLYRQVEHNLRILPGSRAVGIQLGTLYSELNMPPFGDRPSSIWSPPRYIHWKLADIHWPIEVVCGEDLEGSEYDVQQNGGHVALYGQDLSLIHI